MKHLNQYKNESFNFKSLTSYKTESFNFKSLPLYITEYIIKKKLDKPINSEDHYKYFPKTREELIENIKELINNKIYDLNCIDTSKITDMSLVFGEMLKIHDKDFDVSEWDVSNVENMEGMFRGCKKFKGKGLDKWNPVNLKVIREMFDNCDMKDKPKWFYDKCYSYKNKKHKRMYF